MAKVSMYIFRGYQLLQEILRFQPSQIDSAEKMAGLLHSLASREKNYWSQLATFHLKSQKRAGNVFAEHFPYRCNLEQRGMHVFMKEVQIFLKTSSTDVEKQLSPLLKEST